MSVFLLIHSIDLLSVPPGFKHGVTFSDAKQEEGWYSLFEFLIAIVSL